MTAPVRRYPLDPTGRSPNNFIQGEEHVLGPKAGPYHPVAPYYGPFFDDDVTRKVYRNGALLNPEEHYFTQSLVLTPSRDFSGDVCELIILKNMEEGDVIVLEYQTLGGEFQNNMKNIVDLYNAFLLDNRPVDWMRIMNKPMEFPPAYHLHMLKDVIGWETIIVAIERLINVLSLQGVPAFDALIDWVLARTLEVVSEEEIRNARLVDKVVTMRRMLFAMKTLHFNSMKAKPLVDMLPRGEFFTIDVESTNFPDAQRLYWTISHVDSIDPHFPVLGGAFNLEYQQGRIRIPTNGNYPDDGVKTFRVEIRRESLAGPVLCVTRPLYLVYSYNWEFDYGMHENGVWAIPSTLNTPIVEQTAISHNLIIDDHFYEVSHG